MSEYTPAHIMEVYQRCITPSGAAPLDSPEGKAESRRMAERSKLRARLEKVA